MMILNKACPACGSLHIGRIGNYLTDMVCIIHCYDCGHKVTARAEAAPGKSMQEEILEAELKATALWNGAETCVCCGAAIPEGRQVCLKCEVMQRGQA